jgi:hypothetical protein
LSNTIRDRLHLTPIMRGSLDLMKEPLKISSDNTSEVIVTISTQP